MAFVYCIHLCTAKSSNNIQKLLFPSFFHVGTRALDLVDSAPANPYSTDLRLPATRVAFIATGSLGLVPSFRLEPYQKPCA